MTPETTIRFLLEEDIQPLVACFEACYGQSYANPLFYNEADLVQAIRSGVLRGIVALQGREVLGHTALTVKYPDALVVEAGNTVVAPHARGQGLLGQMGNLLRQRALQDGFVGYLHYPTTAHDIMQKAATRGDGRETGIMLSYVPEETDYHQFDHQGGRLAATVVYQPLSSHPHREVYIPGRYGQLISNLAGRLDIPRTFHLAGIPLTKTSRLAEYRNPLRGVDRLQVIASGNQFGQESKAFVDSSDAEVLQVDLLMADPGIDFAVESLRNQGFVYCAWLPGFAGDDVLRLQLLRNPGFNQFAPNLVTAEAKQLLTLMKQEAGL